MNKHLRWGSALLLLPIVACAGPMPPPPAPVPPPLSSVDQTFLTAAAQGGLAEIAEAQLALKMSHSTAIQKFANEMVSDHTSADQQLTALAAKKSVTLPTTPSDMQQQQANALSQTTGRHFNHDYVSDQVEDHQTMLTLYQQEAANGVDPDVKAFAQSGTSLISHHLEEANALAAMGARHHARHHHG